MKPITGFKSEAANSAGYEMLPKGLYIGIIKDVRLEGSEPDQQIVFRIEITEGEYAGYYTARYKAETENGSKYTVRYKGDYRLQIPAEANSKRQHFDWDLKTFNGAIWAIEDSNDGYHWDWNEHGLKGKAIGINVRQGEYNGSPFTRIGRLESVKQIRAGKVKLMRDLAPKSDAAEPAYPAGLTAVEDVEIPF